MLKQVCVIGGTVALWLPSLAFAKDKSKTTLPYDILRAQTVRVIIDPTAGISLADPQANNVAQRDVETALMNWGRYQVMLNDSNPNVDLVIVVRRGTGKFAGGTMHDPRQGQRPVAIDPTDTGIGIGVQHGPPQPDPGIIPDASQGSATPQTRNLPGGPISGSPYPQIEGGTDTSEDSFIVYRGRVDDPMDSPPVWRYVAKDCLKPHKVPAVDAFHKAVVEADQAASKQP